LLSQRHECFAVARSSNAQDNPRCRPVRICSAGRGASFRSGLHRHSPRFIASEKREIYHFKPELGVEAPEFPEIARHAGKHHDERQFGGAPEERGSDSPAMTRDIARRR